MPLVTVHAAFGKIPAHRDFVRPGGPHASARPLADFLEACAEALARTGCTPAPAPVRLVFRGRGDELLLGAVAPSADGVGRRFPLAIYGVADAARLAPALPHLPEAARALLDAAAALAAGAHGLSAPDLQARVAALPTVDEAALSAAAAQARARKAELRSDGMLERLLGPGQDAYAVNCLRLARQAGPAGVVLRLPARDLQDRWLWLELLGVQAAAALWREEDGAPLVVCLGRAPGSALALAWGCDVPEPRHWPVSTAQPGAIDAARRALGPAALAALAGRDLCLGSWIAALSPGTEAA